MANLPVFGPNLKQSKSFQPTDRNLCLRLCPTLKYSITSYHISNKEQDQLRMALLKAKKCWKLNQPTMVRRRANQILIVIS